MFRALSSFGVATHSVARLQLLNLYTPRILLKFNTMNGHTKVILTKQKILIF